MQRSRQRRQPDRRGGPGRLGALAVALALGVAVIGGAQAQAPGRRPGAPPPAVVTITVHRQELDRSAEFIGRVQAIKSVDLRARVEGTLQRVAFEGGQDVSQGDLLYVIQPAQYRAALAAAQAQVQSANASLQQATQALQRQQTLYKRGSGTEVALEQAQAQHDVAAANLAAVQAQQQTAQLNLDYTRITAPIAGRIGATAVTAGNVVGPSSGTLATVVQLAPIRVVFSINERQLVAYKQKHPDASQAEINARFIPKLRLPDGSLYNETGRVAFVDNRVDPSTGTLAVYADFPNPQRLLLPGMLVTAVLRPENPAYGFVVPAGAVQQDRKGKYLLVVGPNNTVARHTITPGPEIAQSISVTAGLSEGDRVIVEGGQKVHPGVVVNPVPEGQGARLPTAGSADSAGRTGSPGARP